MFRLGLGLILVALPLLELAVLIKTGQVVGFWATLALVVGGAIFGAYVLSRQSRGALRRAAQAMEQGRPPMADALDGALLLMAGMLLITPGFVTDFMALLLLIPPLRHAAARWTVKRVLGRGGADVRTDHAAGQPPDEGTRPTGVDPGKGPIIEGEFERLGEKPPDPEPTER